MKKNLAVLLALFGLIFLSSAAQADQYPVNPNLSRVERIRQIVHSGKRARGNMSSSFSLNVLSEPDYDTPGEFEIVKKTDSGDYLYEFYLEDDNLDLDLSLLYDKTTKNLRFTLPAPVYPTDYTLTIYGEDEENDSNYFYLEYKFTVSPDADHPTLDQVVSRVVEECRVAGNDWQTALNLHDWLTHHAYYDDPLNIYGADGVLIRGTGVCDSYSKAYLLLLNNAGIVAERLISDDMWHAWNRVYIDGIWAQVDVTWDDPVPETHPQTAVSGSEYHHFFCVSDAFLMDGKYNHTIHYGYDFIHPCETMANSAIVRLQEEYPLADNWIGDDYISKGTYTALIQAELDQHHSSFDIHVYDLIDKGNNKFYDTVLESNLDYFNGLFHLFALAKQYDQWQDADGSLLSLAIAFLPDERVFHVEADVVPLDLSEAEIVLASQDPIIFTGDPIEPGLQITVSGIVLAPDVDYTVEYQDNTHAGTATASVTGLGRVTGTSAFSFDIVPKDINDVAIKSMMISFEDEVLGVEYPGRTIWIDENDQRLDQNCLTELWEVDLDTLIWTKTIQGIGDYTGTKVSSGQYTQLNISHYLDWGFNSPEYEYIGGEIKPVNMRYMTRYYLCKERSSYDFYPMTEGVDYTVSCENNICPGNASVTITGIGRYTGTRTKEFTIIPFNLSTANITSVMWMGNGQYNGRPQTREFDLAPGFTSRTASLKSGIDYDVTYENNVNAGTATAILTAKSDFVTGTKRYDFSIYPCDLSQLDAVLKMNTFVYSGQEKRPVVQLAIRDPSTMGNVIYLDPVVTYLQEGTDYEVLYENNIEAGTATAVINAKGTNTTGTNSVDFSILPGGEKVCRIPQNTDRLEQEAFAGTDFREIILPDNPVTVETGCFRDLTAEAVQITIPNAASTLNPAAFSGLNNLTIIAPSSLQINSILIEEYCRRNGFWYEAAE